MIDIKLIRKDKQSIETKLKTKDPSIDLTQIVDLDDKIRDLKTKSEQLKAMRNAASDQIGLYKREKKDTSLLMQEVAKHADELQQLNQALIEAEETFNFELSKLPNIPMDDIKVAMSPAENVLIKQVGKNQH